MSTWWVGGYGSDMEGTAEGIGVMRSRADGTLEFSHVAASMLSPTFLARDGDHLYAVAEGSGHVHSFLIDGEHLIEDGVVASGGGWPCQLEVADGLLIVSNYETGEVAVVSRDARGAVLELVQALPAVGSGPHPEQDGPHAHAALLLDDVTVLSADLGADRLYLHSLEGGRLTRTGEVEVPPGTGPRDLVRHSSGHVLVSGEHGRTLSSFEWTGRELLAVASVSLPGAEATDQTAAIGFGPHGEVYCGLRGSNRISVLTISDDGRTITPLGSVPSGGVWPRHLAVDGEVIHVSNQESNGVASLRIGADGMPQLIADATAVPSPTFLLRMA